MVLKLSPLSFRKVSGVIAGGLSLSTITCHEHSSSPDYDHGGFPVHETRARLFAFLPPALITHPCFNAPPSPQILVVLALLPREISDGTAMNLA
jgi:hypothetical protein